MDTSNLGLAELRLVAEKAEKALDGCLDAVQVVENKIAALLRANILVALSAVGLLITSANARAYALSIVILLVGSLTVAIILLFANRSFRMPFSGDSWEDFQDKDAYAGDERGLLRYLIEVSLNKIRIVREVNESRQRLLDYSLVIAILAIAASAGVFLYTYSAAAMYGLV